MSKPNILIIESDLPTIELYRGILKHNYEVFADSDGSRIQDLLKKHAFKAIILEPAIGMGIGWQFFTTIHSITGENPVPLIVCTTSDERKRGLEMGAAAFLIKPVLPDLLIETLSHLQQDLSSNY